MKALGILTAASLALAPAFAGAASTDTTENKRPEAGPVASANHTTVLGSLTPDAVIVPGIGFTGLLFCALFCGDGGGGGTAPTTTTTTTTTTN